MLQCSSHSSLFIAITFVKMGRRGQMGNAPYSGVPVTGDLTEAVVVILKTAKLPWLSVSFSGVRCEGVSR